MFSYFIFKFSNAVDVKYNRGRWYADFTRDIRQDREIKARKGHKHALIISGPHLEKMGLVKKAADYLASVDIKADIFTDIEANPSVTTAVSYTHLRLQ